MNCCDIEVEMAQHIFKTVYFPRERVRAGKSTRVSISLPATPGKGAVTEAFLSYVSDLSSRPFRLAIGDPVLEILEDEAIKQGRSLSNLCLNLLLEHYTRVHGEDSGAEAQLQLPLHREAGGKAEPKADLGLTFKDSLLKGVYGWYPYVEGFSATYTRDAILRYGKPPRSVYDPFGGSGTTQVAATMMGIPAFFCELNPFMRFVSNTKVAAAQWARRNMADFQQTATAFMDSLTKERLDDIGRQVDLSSYEQAFPGRDFFVEQDLRHLLAVKELTRDAAEPHSRNLLLLAAAANVVACSNMTRRADLRRRRPDEYKTRVVDVASYVRETCQRILSDVAAIPIDSAEMVFVSEDARQLPSEYTNSFEMAITSPPYLNGTNYFRNTKLELWYLDFIQSERDLKDFRTRAVCGGINNVSRRGAAPRTFPFVEEVAQRLEEAARDARIPLMVRSYFSDMFDVFASTLRALTPGGKFLLDIGDSKFYGVHVPTDQLLTEVAREAGLQLAQRHVLARRHSRDKTALVQVELVFQKGTGSSRRRSKERSATKPLATRIHWFRDELPYKHPPFSKRSWGHKLHSLCSYQGKLKPSLAYWLVKEFTEPKATVLDPLGGVGTIPLEAALQGRKTVSNDLSPFASLVAAAKLAPPSLAEAEATLECLREAMAQVDITGDDRRSAEFGLNARVADYYHPDTLEEVLRARKVFLGTADRTPSEVFVWACVLHVLHGNRPYALSRTSHPITPFHPKGEYVYKNLIEKASAHVHRVLGHELPPEFRPGQGLHGDFRALPGRLTSKVDAIITSPPFLGMRFDRPNWLRMWFCGWEAEDFHKRSLTFLERQQARSRDCYKDFIKVCHQLLRKNGLLLIHLGSGGRGDLVGDIRGLLEPLFTLVEEATENVQGLEQHGLQDKGRTTRHHFLFCTRH